MRLTRHLLARIGSAFAQYDGRRNPKAHAPAYAAKVPDAQNNTSGMAFPGKLAERKGFDSFLKVPVSGRFTEALLRSLLASRAWLKGWRRDRDGWLVRARRADDPTELDCTVGFIEECAVAVRTLEDSRGFDTGTLASSRTRIVRRIRNWTADEQAAIEAAKQQLVNVVTGKLGDYAGDTPLECTIHVSVEMQPGDAP